MMTERDQIQSDKPLVSVVMPAYNAARFLRQAVDSVLAQTYGNLELIIVDDCSTDDTLQIMQEYAARDSRVRVIAGEENQGVARVRNRGIQAARGAYIALLDSDDVWVETKLEKQIRLMQETKAQIAYCSVDFVDENDQKTRSFIVPSTTDYREMLVRCFFICSMVVVEAELLKKHPFNPAFYHEDYMLWTELLSIPVTAAGVTEVQGYYRHVQGSRSNNKLNAAKHRWRIYREGLGMGVLESAFTFVRYAFWGVVKYYG